MSETSKQPEQVLVFDTTLRDGEQTPGVTFDQDDKLHIAKRLAELGVDIIEAGSPFSGEDDMRMVSAIASEVDGPVICGLARLDEATGHEDVFKAATAIAPAGSKGGSRIHAYIGTSPFQMKKLRLDEEGIVQTVRTGVTRARSFTDDVEFSPEDASRSNFPFMMRTILEAVDAGATTINIPDTVGKAQPGEYAHRLKRARTMIEERFGTGLVVVSAHCHDDMGNATANTVAAVSEGGARQVEVALGSLGERAGNASLEQVAANIRESFPGVFFTNIRTELLTPIVREAMDRADIEVQPNTPIYGRNAFAHESGTHQAGVRRDKRTYEVLEAEDYGQIGGEMVIGKLSGKAGFGERLADLGIQLNSDEIQRASLAAKKLGQDEKRKLADSDIERIAAEITGETITDRVMIETMTTSVETVRNPESGRLESSQTVEMVISDRDASRPVRRSASSHEGAIASAVRDINDVAIFSGDIVEWKGVSKGAGSTASGGIFVEVRQNGNSVIAYDESTDVVVASVAAYVKAVNMLSRVQERQAR